MRRFLALLPILALAVALAGCRQQPAGAVKVVVIGGQPSMRDPAEGPLSAPDAVLLENVAQGLVGFDSAGNIVPGLAERWNVSDDGLSYIFRIASTEWPDGRKITAQQVARLLKRQIAGRSKNPLKDALGAVEDVVAMTDRVIEIRLIAPRPNLLPLLAQPEFAVTRSGAGSGPFTYSPGADGTALRLTRAIATSDEEATTRQEVTLEGEKAEMAVMGFAAGKSDLVLGGSFTDLPFAERVKAPRGSLRFDPASGLFGLLPLRSGGQLDKPEIRQLLSQAIDRDGFIAALGVPNLAARATLLEPGLDGVPAPVIPAWAGTALGDRLPALQAQANRLLGRAAKPTIRIALPDGPGADLLLRELALDWGALGFKVERARIAAAGRLRVDRRGRAVELGGVVRAPPALWRGAGVRRGNRSIARCGADRADPRPTLCAAGPGRGEDRRRPAVHSDYRADSLVAGRQARPRLRREPLRASHAHRPGAAAGQRRLTQWQRRKTKG